VPHVGYLHCSDLDPWACGPRALNHYSANNRRVAQAHAITRALYSVEHIPHVHCIIIRIYLHSKRAYVADDPYLCIVLGCAYEQKAHGLQWVESIDVANKT
jgi:hypothetical protein